MKRYESLDWLRGLMAFAIMIYHLWGWVVFQPESGNLLGNFGVYGVSVFFVLSGLSMAIVYNDILKDFSSSLIFFVKRLFRIWPLLWLCILLISLPSILRGDADLWRIFLNLTTLFGFIAPDQYINTGAWSIGNELVYYALTPFFIAIYNYKKVFGDLIVFITCLVGAYFGFVLLQQGVDLSEQWSTYINPFNNLFLYCCGLALYYNFHHVDFGKISYLLIGFAILIFGLYPVSGNQINIVTDTNRIVFSFAAIILTLGFYKLIVDLPIFVSKPFANLGEATYGVYLLHPLVYFFVAKIFTNNPSIVIITTVIITIIAANISYRFYEKPLIRLGKKATENISTNHKSTVVD